MISASAALGAYFGFVLGAHQHLALGLIFGGAALGGEILKPFAVAGAVDAFRSREFLRGLTCAALGTVCVLYSLAAELSIAAGTRGDMASARQLSADAVQGARERRTRAAAELAELPAARTPAELAPLIAKARATPGANNCDGPPDGPVSRKVCGDVLAMQSEAARAQRRAELSATIADADKVLAAKSANPIATAGAADPLASALSAYLSALGRSAHADAIAPWLALIPVLFLELGSALALIVVRSIGATPLPRPPAPAPIPAPMQPSPAPAALPAASALPAEPSALVAPIPAEPSTVAAPSADAARKPRKGRGDDDGGMPPGGQRRLEPLADVIRANGGRLQGGQRGIAKLLGVSKSRANELLHELAAAGAVRLATGRRGTVVELATPA